MQECTTAIHLCHNEFTVVLRVIQKSKMLDLWKSSVCELMHTLDYELLPSERHVKPCKHFEYPSQTYYQEKQIASGFIEHWNIMLLCQNHGKSRLTSLEYSILCRLPIQASLLTSYMILNLRHGPHVSGAFCILKFFYTDTPSVHMCPPYTLGVSRDFCIRSLEWKFLNTLCIRIHVDTCIRIFLYTLTSQYQNQSFSARDLLTNPLRCPDTNRISVDSRIRFYYTLRVGADIFVSA